MKQLERRLHNVRIAEIDFGKRAREEYELDDLVDDMKIRGVITPITLADKKALSPEDLKELKETDEKLPFILMAGGRRTLAAQKAGFTEIPAQIFSHTLDRLELRIIEMHENTKRRDLSFSELTNLRAEVHELLEAKYGKKISTAADAEGVSLRDSAEFIGVSAATLSQDVRLKAAMETHPELRDAETRKEALKKLDEIYRKAAQEELAERIRKRQALTDTQKAKKELAASFKIGNFFDEVLKVADESINFVEIDPPYAIDLSKVKRNGDTDDYNEIDAGLYEGFMKELFRECYRVMTPNSWLVCWFGPDPWFEPIASWIEEAGFTIKRLPAVWTKRTGQALQPNRYLASAAEFFFYARKGDPGLNKPGRINVFEYAPVGAKTKRHPTERPIEMIEDLLDTFARPGALVMVPFLGSGNTILAAYKKGMIAFGWDLSQPYKDSFDLKVMTEDVGSWKSY